MTTTDLPPVQAISGLACCPGPTKEGSSVSLRILISGSRDWADTETIGDVLARAITAATGATLWPPTPDAAKTVTVVHGGARGADTIAGDIARQWGMTVEVHRADWHTYGTAAGPRRNKVMVELGADVLLAFPAGESKGTRDCIRRAEKAGIPVVVTEGAETHG